MFILIMVFINILPFRTHKTSCTRQLLRLTSTLTSALTVSQIWNHQTLTYSRILNHQDCNLLRLCHRTDLKYESMTIRMTIRLTIRLTIRMRMRMLG